MDCSGDGGFIIWRNVRVGDCVLLRSERIILLCSFKDNINNKDNIYIYIYKYIAKITLSSSLTLKKNALFFYVLFFARFVIFV